MHLWKYGSILFNLTPLFNKYDSTEKVLARVATSVDEHL